LMIFFSSGELGWALSIRRLSPETVFRYAFLAWLFVWLAWLSLRSTRPSSPSRLQRLGSILIAGTMLHLLLTWVVARIDCYVRNTALAVWNPWSATELLPRLMGHLTLITAILAWLFLLGGVMAPLGRRMILTVLFVVAACSLMLGSALWSTFFFSVT